MDREGHGAVLFRTALVAALMPLLWLAGSRGFPWPIWLAALADALAWSGLNTALAQAPKAARGGYLALFWLALGLGGLVGSLGAGGLARLSPNPSPYHLPILASA